MPAMRRFFHFIADALQPPSLSILAPWARRTGTFCRAGQVFPVPPPGMSVLFPRLPPHLNAEAHIAGKIRVITARQRRVVIFKGRPLGLIAALRQLDADQFVPGRHIAVHAGGPPVAAVQSGGQALQADAVLSQGLLIRREALGQRHAGVIAAGSGRGCPS